MQINSITSFRAKIPTTTAAERIGALLDFAKNYDYNNNHSNYESLCKDINKLLPKNSDEVIFNNCDAQYGSSYYIEGEINHNNNKNLFSSCVYYRSGSNTVARDIISSIKKALIE